MKQLLLSLILFSSGLLIGQQDCQWMVRDGHPRNIIDYDLTTVGSEVYVGKIKEPAPIIGSKIHSNDFFVITESGEYFMNNWKGASLTTTGSAYIYNKFYSGLGNIKHLYLTNRYEDDEPPEMIKVLPVPGSNTPASAEDLTGLISQGYNYGYFTNHNLVNGKDITFIFDSDDLTECNAGYKLTHDEDPDLLSLLPSSFTDGGPVNFDNGLVRNVGGFNTTSSAFFGNYTYLPSLPFSNAFYNYRVFVDPSLINEEIIFTIESDDRTCKTLTDTILVSDKYHDPNFIELKCVWEEGGRKFGLYHVECFNSKNAPVLYVKLEAQLPSVAIPNSVNLLSWSICCQNGCGEGKGQLSNLSFNDVVKAGFPYQLKGGLDGKSCKNTAWFEFVVEFDSNTNLVFDDLMPPSIPQSHFEKDRYHITSFYDHMSCYSLAELDSLDVLGHQKMNIYQGQDPDCYQGRTVQNCNDGCHQISCWQKIKSKTCEKCKKSKILTP